MSVQAGKPKAAEAAKVPSAANGQAGDAGQPAADHGYRETGNHANGATQAGPREAALQMWAPTRAGIRYTSTMVYAGDKQRPQNATADQSHNVQSLATPCTFKEWTGHLTPAVAIRV